MRHAARRKNRVRVGFTLFEVLLVIALTAFAVAMAGPFLSDTLSRNSLDAAVDEAVEILEEARVSAASGRFGGRYGVLFESDRFVLFEGESFSEGDPENIVRGLSGLVSVTDIDIEGGGDSILFRGPSGSPVAVGSIEFTDSSGGKRTVSVNEAGLVDVQ